ncbi:hypothetical protein DPMN_023674 [Dreissena polymorpha]|uniref:Uncharacterized protein n=1 Tax=Dreissena polymorpha TaxID=45954 RepID=A0A9D4LLL3_DREPO|nr:hypothetical protein DPMN_023674 [Dreissena polymorpha]
MQQLCSIIMKTVLISNISHTRDEDQNVNPSMSFNKEQNDHAKMRTSFLVTKKNKSGMIALISTALTKRGSYVIVSPGDADVEIVKATVE